MKLESLKYVALIAYIAITIVTSAGAFNYAAVSHEGIYTVAGILNLLVMGGVLIKAFKQNRKIR